MTLKEIGMMVTIKQRVKRYRVVRSAVRPRPLITRLKFNREHLLKKTPKHTHATVEACPMPRSGVKTFNEIKHFTISLIGPHSSTTRPIPGEVRIPKS